MSNLCAITVKITGEDRQRVKEMFDKASVQTSYGSVWKLYDGVIRCDAKHGDGITAEQDSIIIKGETDWDLQFNVVQTLSQQLPDLTFEIQSTELTNLWSQRWIFEAGEGRLLDCVQNADNDEPRIDYMLNGDQLLPLPEWVPAIDESEDDAITNPVFLACKAIADCFSDERICDEWRYDGQSFFERVEAYVLSTIESLEAEIEGQADNPSHSRDEAE